MAQASVLMPPQAEFHQPVYAKIGSYLIQQTLGKGLMEVKLGVDSSIQNAQKHVAVKICKSNHQKHNLEQEAAILKEL